MKTNINDDANNATLIISLSFLTELFATKCTVGFRVKLIS